MLPLTQTELTQLNHLYGAIDNINGLIAFYEKKSDLAYLTCDYVNNGTKNVQLNADILIDALNEQRTRYINKINEMGVDYVLPAKS